MIPLIDSVKFIPFPRHCSTTPVTVLPFLSDYFLSCVFTVHVSRLSVSCDSLHVAHCPTQHEHHQPHPHHTTPHHITSHHITSHHITSHHTTLYHFAMYHTALCINRITLHIITCVWCSQDILNFWNDFKMVPFAQYLVNFMATDNIIILQSVIWCNNIATLFFASDNNNRKSIFASLHFHNYHISLLNLR